MPDCQKKQYYFFAFISYKREDEKWAKWLQKRLEYYKLPASVREKDPSLPKTIRPIFKDTTDLEPGFLQQKIQDALCSSKFLIVICSPRSAGSVWVSKEAQFFIDNGRAYDIIPFIIDGIPNAPTAEEECYPEALRRLKDNHELLGANINEMGREAAAIKIVARMFNLRFDVLWQRYNRDMKKRRRIILVSILIFIAALILVITVISNKNEQLKTLNTSLHEKTKALNNSYDTIWIEKERLRKSNTRQSISLGESKLRIGDVGFAIDEFVNVKKNQDILDNEDIQTYNELLRSLSDSLSNKSLSIIDILDTKKDSARTSQFLGCKKMQCDYEKVYFTYNRKGIEAKDTTYIFWKLYNRNLSMYASCDSQGDDRYSYRENILDLNYENGKNGIFIFSSENNKLLHFVCCGGWFPSLLYPIALNSDGSKLIYRTGYRENDYTCFVDFNNQNIFYIHKYLGNGAYLQHDYEIDGAFSKYDDYFCIRTKKGYCSDYNVSKISIYNTQTLKLVNQFSFTDCENVFWDNEDHLNVVCTDNTYIWSIPDKSMRYEAISLNEAVQNVAISTNNDIASISVNGTMKVWKDCGRIPWYIRNGIISPDDLEFCDKDNSIWITTGYDELYIAEPGAKTQSIDYDSETPSHHWTNEISFLKNGQYCITKNHYISDKIHYFDTDTRKYVKTVNSTDTIPAIFPIQLIHRIDSIDKTSETPSLTSVKISKDKKYIIRGYYDGRIICSDYGNYRLLFDKLGIYPKTDIANEESINK